MRALTEALIIDAASAVGPQAPDKEGGDAPDRDPLVRNIGGRRLDLHPPYTVTRMADLVQARCGVDVLDRWDAMPQVAAELNVEVASGHSSGAALLGFYGQKVQPELG